MRKGVFWSAMGALALLAIGGGVLHYLQSTRTILPGSRADAAQPAQHSAGVAVEVSPVIVDTVIEDIRAVGTLRPNEAVVISPEISGRIARIRFLEGEQVKEGEVLVELDATILQAELDKVRSDAALAKANQERAQTLAKQGSGTQRAHDEALAAYQAAQANLALAEARLQKTELRAPLSGTVGLRTVSVGAYVTPGERIVELAETDPLKVDFRVPETSIAQLRIGQGIVVTADAVPGATFEGKVYAIDPIVDVNGRAIRLRAQVPNPDGRLLAGFFARVRIVVDRRPNALLVPESAIFPLQGRTLVYRVVDNRAVQTEVVLGQRLPGQVEVREGLTAKDIVVRAGQQRLREGAEVQVVAPPPGV